MNDVPSDRETSDDRHVSNHLRPLGGLRDLVMMAALCAAAGCSQSDKSDEPTSDVVDSATIDATQADSLPLDAGATDVSQLDASVADGVAADASPADGASGSVSDANPADATVVDADDLELGSLDGGGADAITGDPSSCSLTYALPGDVTQAADKANQDLLDRFSWQTFLAINTPKPQGSIAVAGDPIPQWQSWSSTTDLLDGLVSSPTKAPAFGAHHYPAECTQVVDYKSYRVLEQVGKVSDSLFEATDPQGHSLSSNPVTTANGFVRYEIVINKVMFDYVVSNKLYEQSTLAAAKQVNFPCGQQTYTGGDPGDVGAGAMMIKLAWMPLAGLTASQFHTEDLLVYNGPSRISKAPKAATCTKVTMALVGMHVVRKTQTQPTWIWSTFEHENNAPNCTAMIGSGGGVGAVNSSCPDSVTKDWNFFSKTCSKGAKNAAACAKCNTGPAPNGGGCTAKDGWCVDAPLNNVGGQSKLCRQVDVATGYPTAFARNKACAKELTKVGSTWANYELISTQWYTKVLNNACTEDVSSQIAQAMGSAAKNPFSIGKVKADLAPQVPTTAGNTVPLSGNTSMESYERSNCLGCHAKSTVDHDTAKTAIRTDFVYWLGLQVPAAGLGAPNN